MTGSVRREIPQAKKGRHYDAPLLMTQKPRSNSRITNQQKMINTNYFCNSAEPKIVI
jgi:hypothetical protein